MAGERIKQARKSAGLSQVELAAAMGVTQSVVSDWENDKLQSWQDHADKLASVLKQPKGHFHRSGSSAVHTQGIEVVGAVQGGSFRLAVEWPQEERFEVPVAPLPGYEGIQLRALRVDGPSMNQVYPDGCFVIVADVADTDVRPGDRVVVYRSQGELRESSVKEIQVDADGRVALWPRSTHQDFQEPIYLPMGAQEDDQDAPEIAYVVVGSFNLERRPPPPIHLGRKRKRTEAA